MADDDTTKKSQDEENEETGEKGGQVTQDASEVDFDTDDMGIEENQDYEE